MSEPEDKRPDQKFHLGRLLGFIFVVILVSPSHRRSLTGRLLAPSRAGRYKTRCLIS